MSTNKPGRAERREHVHDLAKLRGHLKVVGGSMSDDWNNLVANQTIQTLWLKNSSAEEIRRQRHAAVDALIGITAGDELEGMIAAQLIAAHNAACGSPIRDRAGDAYMAACRVLAGWHQARQTDALAALGAMGIRAWGHSE